MTKLPVAVCAENPSVLEAALRYFQGRLIVDSRSAIEPEVLEPLTAKYGAILY
jgi:5-methyltetrahydrofolate--homocysteine methyltransferase